ncbi:MAG: hypothetical protein EHM47_08740 [Ignavibacteriales bacterium]|nr:MAG: hypothetical protein EHM47_08740 [Ignavibacteriales bacterium]
MEIVENYKSSISLQNFSNKLYIDPQFGEYQPQATINYAVFSSKWDIEDIGEDNILKIIHRESGDSISLAFKSFKDKVEFARGIYANKPVKQIGQGINLEVLANGKLKPKPETLIDDLLKKVTLYNKRAKKKIE